MVSFFGDFDTTETVVIPFNTFDSNDPSASVTLTNLANTDVDIHKDGSLTQRSSASGVAVDVDVDGIAGCHWVTIDLSDNTDAGFYADGSQYSVRIEGVTVDAATINPWIGAFSIGRMLRPTTAGRTLDVTATGAAGIDWGNVENPTTALDLSGTDIQLVDTTTTNTDMRGTDSAATATALATAQADLDTITGAAGALLDTTATSAQLVDDVWDEVLTGATHNVVNSAGRRLRQIQEAGGYSGGFIYIDTVNGTAGTTDFENGVDSNPVDSIADANTIAASLGLSQFKISPDSTITLAATQADQVFIGKEWTLALGGQNIAGSYFEGATVSGTGTGANPHFFQCEIGTVTFAANRLGLCRFMSTITLSAASDYFWHDCYSGVAGATMPVVDFGAAVGNTNLSMRRYSGGLQINNKDATGTDQMSLEGDGQLTVAASSSGAIQVRGNFKVTNTGGATITYDDNTQNLIDVQTQIGTAGDGLTAINLPNQTMDIIGDITGNLSGSVGSVTGAVGSVTGAVGSVAGNVDGNVTGSVGSVVGLTASNLDATISSRATPAQVNTEMVDVITVDTISLPGQAAPTSTPTLAEGLSWLYKAFRNRKTQTATEWQLLADNESTVDSKATVSDDGTTAIKQEIVSGP